MHFDIWSYLAGYVFGTGFGLILADAIRLSRSSDDRKGDDE